MQHLTKQMSPFILQPDDRNHNKTNAVTCKTTIKGQQQPKSLPPYIHKSYTGCNFIMAFCGNEKRDANICNIIYRHTFTLTVVKAILYPQCAPSSKKHLLKFWSFETGYQYPGASNCCNWMNNPRVWTQFIPITVE